MQKLSNVELNICKANLKCNENFTILIFKSSKNMGNSRKYNTEFLNLVSINHFVYKNRTNIKFVCANKKYSKRFCGNKPIKT